MIHNEDEDCALEGLYHLIVPRDASRDRLELQAAIARSVSAARKPLTLSVFYSVALVGAEGLWGDADVWSGAQHELFCSAASRMWCSVRATREAEVVRENTRYAPLLPLKVSA